MYKKLIRPEVLYGNETWTMLEGVLQALGIVVRRVLSTILWILCPQSFDKNPNYALAATEPTAAK